MHILIITLLFNVIPVNSHADTNQSKILKESNSNCETDEVYKKEKLKNPGLEQRRKKMEAEAAKYLAEPK